MLFGPCKNNVNAKNLFLHALILEPCNLAYLI